MRALFPLLGAVCLSALLAVDAQAQPGGSAKGQPATGKSSAAGPSANPTGNPPPAGIGSPWERTGQSRADWLLAQRLTAIEHLRDVAVKHNNPKLLKQADYLEAVARRQHANRTGDDFEPPGKGRGRGPHDDCPDPATP
jgi:hypothetical protein